MSSDLTRENFTAFMTELVQKSYPGVTAKDLAPVVDVAFRYRFVRDIKDDLRFSMESVQMNIEAEQMAHKLDEEVNPKIVVGKLKEEVNNTYKGVDLDEEPVHKKAVKQEGPSVGIQNELETKQKAIKSEQEAQRKFMMSKYLNHPDKDKMLRVAHENLNFDTKSEGSRVGVQLLVGQYNIQNSMYLTKKDIVASIETQYKHYEYIFNSHFSANIVINRFSTDVKSYVEPTAIFGRLTFDNMGQFSKDQITMETLSEKGKFVKINLNFQECDSLYHIFPNMYLIVLVKGEIVDEMGALKVVNVLELDQEKDSLEEIALEPKTVYNHRSVLVFKGPYQYPGKDRNSTQLFSAFDSIADKIKEKKPSVAILIGPFITEETFPEGISSELEKSDSFDALRSRYILNLIEKVSSDCALIFVQDAAEIDNYYVTPMKNTFGNLRHDTDPNKLVMFCDSPCLLELDKKFRIAIGSEDMVKPMLKFPNNSVGKKFISPMRAVIGQRNLHPVFPGTYPVDLTQMSQMNYQECEKPHVIISPSILVDFAAKIRGTLVCNPKTVYDGDNFGKYGQIWLDCEHNESDATNLVRVEVRQF